MFERKRDEDVKPFADRLEHYKVQRNSRQRVEHAEDLSAGSFRCTIAVTCKQLVKLIKYGKNSQPKSNGVHIGDLTGPIEPPRTGGPRGGPKGHALKRPTNFVLFCKKTDFRTNWLTSRVVIMQNGVELGFAP